MVEPATDAIQVSQRLSAVVIADLVGSVPLTEKDPAGTVARWRKFVADVTYHELSGRGGRVVKMLGDGFLLEFPAAVAAVDCAVALHRRIADVNSEADASRRMQLRVGVHLADVLADDVDLYGEGAYLAARLMALAAPGETIVSGAVRDELTDGLDVSLEDLGDRWLKGVDRPVRAFRASPPDIQRMRSPNHRLLAGSRPSIAVLPFRVLSEDPTHRFFGDLLAEDLIGTLSVQSELVVISRLSTAPFRERFYEPRNVAEILGVRYALSGTMQSSGTRVRLIAELTDVEAGQAVWAERFEGQIIDIFDLQDQLSRDIAVRVIPLVRQRELERVRAKRPENLTAYERTLRAIDHLQRSSPSDLEQAKQMLEAAIKSDPNYAAPHAWLAQYYVRRVGQGGSTSPLEDTQSAYRHAEAALERDEGDAWVLSVNGLVAGYLEKDLDKAMGLYDRALTINPSTPAAWIWSTSALAWLDRGQEAVARAPRAGELSPFDPNMYVFNGMSAIAHAVAGNYERSVELARQSLRQNAMYLSTHRILAIALGLAGRLDESKAAVSELMKLEPTLTVDGFMRRYPGRNTEHAARFAAALSNAGVPP